MILQMESNQIHQKVTFNDKKFAVQDIQTISPEVQIVQLYDCSVRGEGWGPIFEDLS